MGYYIDLARTSRAGRRRSIRHTVARSTQRLRPAMTVLLLAFVTVSALALITVSPLALKKFEMLRGFNWSQLSNIGQTYGAASALLTGLALVGVAGSLIFQVRTIRLAREQSSQEHQFHLVEMALQDPIYLRAWGDDPSMFGTLKNLQQHYYVNLIISFWERAYLVGDLPEHALRGELMLLFHGQAGRRFWDHNKDFRTASARSRRSRHFCQIVDEEYRRSIASGPPAVLAEDERSSPGKTRRRKYDCTIFKMGSAVLLGAISGVAIKHRYQQKKQ